MEHHKDIDYRFPMAENAPSLYQKHVGDLMKAENAHVMVALGGNQVVGFAVLHVNQYPPVFKQDNYGMIDDMAVKAKYRRKGIGRKMLDAIYTWFKARNIKRVELSVVARNKAGYSFWKKNGFKDFTHRLYLDV
jgi:GNAT superfamily N-acetyltransferase